MNEAGQGAEDRTARRPRRDRVRRSEAATDTWLDAWFGVPTSRPGDPRDALDEATGPVVLPGTADALRSVEAHGWTVLHDLHRPGRTRATVEHVVVGPGGVVVIETLRWDGEVQVVEATLRHRGYGRTPDVAAVADTASAVTALLAPSHRRTVHAVVTLLRQDLDPVAVCGGAVATGLAQLPAYLVSLPAVLAPADVPLVVDYLTAELAGAASPEQLTVDDVFRPRVVWDAPDVPQPHPRPSRPATREPWPEDRLGEWPVADSGDETIARLSAHERAVRPADETADLDDLDALTGQDADPYTQPVAGLAGVPAPASAPTDRPRWWALRRRPGEAPGDALLRSAMVVLGLLTAGNLVLAWLSAR
jgi:hypothetical protein